MRIVKQNIVARGGCPSGGCRNVLTSNALTSWVQQFKENFVLRILKQKPTSNLWEVEGDARIIFTYLET
jgi:hypothetical protein